MNDALVGRDMELGRIAAFLERPDALRGAFAIDGEAGIGKTRLWEEGVELARSSGYRVLVTRPTFAESQLSFVALGDLLRPVLEGVLSRLALPRARALEVALLVRPSRGRPPDRRAIGLALVDALSVLSADAPVVVAVDDLQWVDAASGHALEFAIRRVEAQPVGALATVRNGGAALPFDLDRALAQRLQRMHVGPLPLVSVRELLRARLGLELPRDLLERVHEVSGGNPLFALEIARFIQARSDEIVAGEPLPLPNELRDVIAARLDGLKRPVRTTVAAAALLARPTVPVLERSFGPRAAGHVERAVRAGVLERDENAIRFAHPLLAAVAESALAPAERRRLHRRLEQAVTEIEERARHLALAAQGPDAEAAALAEEAARHAAGRSAYAIATTLMEHAWRLTPPGDEREWARRGLSAADLADNGAGTHARAIYGELLAHLGPGPLRALAAVRATRANSSEHRVTEAMLVQAIAEAGPVDDAALAELHSGLSSAAFKDCRHPDASLHARDALAHAERTGDDTILADALVRLAEFTMLGAGGLQREAVERALELQPPAIGGEMGLPWRWARMLTWAGLYDQAREQLHQLGEVAAERGLDGLTGLVLLQLVKLDCLTGDIAAARARLDEARRLVVHDVESGRLDAALAYAEVLADACCGDAVAARAGTAPVLEWIAERGDLNFGTLVEQVLGSLALAEGDPATAHSHLGPAVERTASVAEPGAYRVLPDEIEALIQLGELDTAERLLVRLEDQARTLDRPWALATAARARGLLLERRGDPAGALVALAGALEHHDRVDEPLERGRTLLALGSVRRRAQQKAAARETLTAALAIFEHVGARLWAAQTRVELGRIGGRSAATAEDELSGTEAQVARLAAVGLTNREVAAALSLSAKTVEWNLSKIYRKLGVRSRTELASRVPRE